MSALAAARLGRLRAFLADAPFDWLLLGEPQHVLYATDYRSVAGDIFRGHQLLALVGLDDIWMVGSAADGAAALDTGIPSDRYVAFGRFFFESVTSADAATRFADQHPDVASAAATAVRALGPGPVTIGVDAGVSVGVRDAVESLPAVTGVWDASAHLHGVRSVKLAGEVELLGRAAALAEQGIQAAFAAAEVGMTERDLASVVSATMAAGGGEPRFVVVTAGLRSALSDARPTDRALQGGDLLRLDVGCTVDGYWSDTARTAVVGQPDKLQAGRYAALLAGEQAQLAAAKPGLPARDLFKVAVDTVEADGIQPYRRHHCGHAIGGEVYERPIVSATTDDELSEGMVLCVETPFYEIGWGGMMVEDTIVVTGDGAQLLTTADRELRVIPS